MFAPRALAPAKLAEPSLGDAQRHELRLSASAAASEYPDIPPIVLPDWRRIDLLDTLCSTSRTLWAIDGKTWPQAGHEQMPPPLMTFARGTPVRLTLANTTPHVHPMHVHGHSFKVEVSIESEVDPTVGWIYDHANISDAMKPLLKTLDHTYVNDIEGLENPTIENMAEWFWKKLEPLCPGLCEIVVHETPTARCIYRGP